MVHPFTVTCPQGNLSDCAINPTKIEAGLSIWHAAFTFADKTAVGEVALYVEFPMHGHLTTFTPLVYRDCALHQWFGATRVRSDFFYNAPFLSAVNNGHDNYATVAVSDAVNTVHFALGVRDFDEREKIRIDIVLPPMAERAGHFEVDIYIDERPRSMADTLADLGAWFRAYYPDRYPCPQAAEAPLYSSWYNCHQHPNAELLDRELDIAAKLGLGTLIIDDGWQYDGLGTGDYRDCGDWAVSAEKFPDLKAFAERAHARGIRVMLWFPVPFVGKNTEAYRAFKDRLLYENGDAGILDVRYAEVRAHIVGFLSRFVRDYDLDGLKLDFIDSFVNHPQMPPVNDQMDQPVLGRAVTTLLEEVDEALRAIRPEVLLEYRQNYVGPAITRYGNMLRVADCAFASDVNRVGVADLRLLNYKLAVHSDMLYWAQDETPENVARQLLCTLFAVPQISVLLTQVPASHRAVIREFLRYHNENHDTLLHGRFDFVGMDRGYPMISAADDRKTVTALYQPLCVHYKGGQHDIFNATPGDEVTLINDTSLPCSARLFDATGAPVGRLTLMLGAHCLTLPIGGRIEIDG